MFITGRSLTRGIFIAFVVVVIIFLAQRAHGDDKVVTPVSLLNRDMLLDRVLELETQLAQAQEEIAHLKKTRITIPHWKSVSRILFFGAKRVKKDAPILTTWNTPLIIENHGFRLVGVDTSCNGLIIRPVKLGKDTSPVDAFTLELTRPPGLKDNRVAGFAEYKDFTFVLSYTTPTLTVRGGNEDTLESCKLAVYNPDLDPPKSR